MTEKKILVAATTNGHKIAEISAVAGSFDYEVVSRVEAGVPDFEIEENGATFEENSLIKAQAIFDALGGAVAVVSDDSGIEVDALDGAPGVYSARFAGQEAPGRYRATEDGDAQDFAEADMDIEQLHRSRQDRANNAKLLRLLGGVPAERRTARFVSVITCLIPGDDPSYSVDPADPAGLIICRGEVEGHVDARMTGPEGFGYDPLFIPLGYDRSFGLFTQKDKNKISHRGKALTMLGEKLGAEQPGEDRS